MSLSWIWTTSGWMNQPSLNMVLKLLKSEKSLKVEPSNKIWRTKTNMIMSQILKTNLQKNYIGIFPGALEKLIHPRVLSKLV
jgi:hypothetical protein